MSPPMLKCILRQEATMTKIPELNSMQRKIFFVVESLAGAIAGNGIASSNASVKMFVTLMIQTYS